MQEDDKRRRHPCRYESGFVTDVAGTQPEVWHQGSSRRKAEATRYGRGREAKEERT